MQRVRGVEGRVVEEEVRRGRWLVEPLGLTTAEWLKESLLGREGG
jgi:hypothetical protein